MRVSEILDSKKQVGIMQTNLNLVFAQNLNLGNAVASVFNAHIFEENRVLIGSDRGRCYQLSMNKFDKLELIYEDPKQRQIIAIGFWPFSHEKIGNQFASFSKENSLIWLHFRSSAISIFEFTKNNRFSPLRELSTNHYGFCRAFADSLNGRLFIPDHEDCGSFLRVRYQNGDETVIRLEEDFLNKKLGLQGENAMFQGMLMGIETLEKFDNIIFLAFEDSTICVFNWQAKEVRDALKLKHPKHCEFLCWSLLTKTCTGQTLIAISVIGQLYLLSYFDSNESGNTETLQAECVIKKCKNNNDCTSVALSNSNINLFNQNNGRHCQMGVGLKNGTILIYSLQPDSNHSPPQWSHQLLAQCTNAHSNSIQCLRWIPHPIEEFAAQSVSSRPSNSSILCSGGGEKISFFEFSTSNF